MYIRRVCVCVCVYTHTHTHAGAITPPDSITCNNAIVCALLKSGTQKS